MVITAKKKEMVFEFVVNVPPDEDCIERSHQVIADAFIEKYGIEAMKEVVRQIQAKEVKA